jgi:TolB protein
MGRVMQFAVTRRARGLLAVLVLASAALVVTAPASATSPGYNGKIAFSRDNGYGVDTTGIYTINPDGTGLQQLTHGAGVFASYGPDGSQIAYLQAPGLHVMNQDGSNDQLLLSQGAFGLSWSPDGSKFMWMTPVDGRSVISVENSDGSEVHQLLSGDLGSRYFPAWSPDGNLIAFWEDTSNYLGVVNADGSNERHVLDAPGAHEPVSFSPDGTKLAYTQRVDMGANPPLNVTHIVNLDGTDDHAIGDTTGHSASAVWSPDGEWLTFVRSGDGAASGLWVIRSDGSGARQLTHGENEVFPTWQPLASPVNLRPHAVGYAQNKLPRALFGNAGASWDFDGTIVKYQWRWGDNTAMTPYEYAWHRYAKAGTYRVRLTVVDNNGAWMTKQAWVTVN